MNRITTLGARLLLLLLILASCQSEKESGVFPEEEILARVGDEVITIRDFQLNYEFGFPHLMRSDRKKEEYLEKMVAELVLATEGYRRGLHQSESIQNALQTLTEERLIEEVFHQHVLSEIQIEEEEVQEMVQQMAVSFEFSFVPAQNRAHASSLQKELMEKPFEEVVEATFSDTGLGSVTPEQFRSELLPALDIEPELLEELKSLELNTPSEPIKYQNQWYVFIINNIVRDPLSPSDFDEKGVSARKIIYNTKAMEGASRFVSETMQPLQVETIRTPFDSLAALLHEWYSSEDIPAGPLWEAVAEGRDENNSLSEIFELRQQILVTTAGGDWTVQEVLEKLNTGRYVMRAGSYNEFAGRFADVIALVIRDNVLLEMANEDNLAAGAEVKRDLRKWENKWVFREMRTAVLEEVPFSDAIVFEYVKNQDLYPEELSDRNPSQFSEEQVNRFRTDYMSDKLMEKAREIQRDFDVKIYYDRLESVEINESAANPNMTFQLLKQHNNRRAFPVLDPVW
jgi:hypothetical protein